METGEHDGVIPSVIANAEEEMNKVIYEHFKETNWWARNQYAWLLICLLQATLVISWIFKTDFDQLIIEYSKAAGAIPLIVFFSFLPTLLSLTIAKYIYHDIPWKKCKGEWSIQGSNCSCDVGGVAKIYD